MSKRNKKYNPIKSALINNEHILKAFAIAFVANDNSSKDPIKLINLKGEEFRVTATMADAITKFRYKWSIMLAVLCIEKGVKTCKLEIVSCKERYLQSDLPDFLNAAHQNFIDKHKAKNVNIIGAGWIASPTGRDFSEDEAGSIFTKIKAWG